MGELRLSPPLSAPCLFQMGDMFYMEGYNLWGNGRKPAVCLGIAFIGVFGLFYTIYYVLDWVKEVCLAPTPERAFLFIKPIVLLVIGFILY